MQRLSASVAASFERRLDRRAEVALDAVSDAVVRDRLAANDGHAASRRVRHVPALALVSRRRAARATLPSPRTRSPRRPRPLISFMRSIARQPSMAYESVFAAAALAGCHSSGGIFCVEPLLCSSVSIPHRLHSLPHHRGMHRESQPPSTSSRSIGHTRLRRADCASFAQPGPAITRPCAAPITAISPCTWSACDHGRAYRRSQLVLISTATRAPVVVNPHASGVHRSRGSYRSTSGYHSRGASSLCRTVHAPDVATRTAVVDPSPQQVALRRRAPPPLPPRLLLPPAHLAREEQPARHRPRTSEDRRRRADRARRTAPRARSSRTQAADATATGRRLAPAPPPAPGRGERREVEVRHAVSFGTNSSVAITGDVHASDAESIG